MSPYMSISYRYTGYGRTNSGQQVSGVQGVGRAAGSSAVPEVQPGRSVNASSGVQGGQNVGSVYGAQASLSVGAALAAGRPASPGTPVEPVSPVSTVEANAPRGIGYMIPFLREGMDPAELAVRMRMKYVDPASQTAQEGECQTCKERKYQDGSDDAGVSYKTPTRIAPDQAASAVRGHEMEHVVRERAAAEREDRRVISQSVTMHTAICPECGTVYISGGTTRTTTAANPQPEETGQQADNGESAAA